MIPDPDQGKILDVNFSDETFNKVKILLDL